MTDPGDVDVVSGGRDDTSGRERPFWSWADSPGAERWRGLPPRTRSIALTVGIALLALAGFGVQSYVQRPPDVPRLTFRAVPINDGDAGAPLGAPSLAADATIVQVQLTLEPTRSGSAQATVTRLVGPGIATAPVIPALRSGARSQSTSVNAVVDCNRLTFPLGPDTFRAHVAVSDGARSTEADTALGAAGRIFADQVTGLCSAHLAASNLMVNEVSGRVDPTTPQVDLALSVVNTGAVAGWVRLTPHDDASQSATAVDSPVPAGNSVVVHTHLTLRRCPSWDQTRLPPDTAETPLALLATVGPDRAPGPGDLAGPWAFGPLPVSPAAAAGLKDLMVEACGGVASPVLLSQQPHASFDHTTRVLTTKLDTYLPQGVVHRVRFLRSDSTDYPQLDPLLDHAWITPDVSGVATATISFRVPPGISCFGGGPTITLDVEVDVGQGAHRRTAVFTLFSETFLVPDDLAVACQS